MRVVHDAVDQVQRSHWSVYRWKKCERIISSTLIGFLWRALTLPLKELEWTDLIVGAARCLHGRELAILSAQGLWLFCGACALSKARSRQRSGMFGSNLFAALPCSDCTCTFHHKPGEECLHQVKLRRKPAVLHRNVSANGCYDDAQRHCAAQLQRTRWANHTAA